MEAIHDMEAEDLIGKGQSDEKAGIFGVFFHLYSVVDDVIDILRRLLKPANFRTSGPLLVFALVGSLRMWGAIYFVNTHGCGPDLFVLI